MEGIYAIYTFIQIIGFLAIGLPLSDDQIKPMWFTPNNLYRSTKMNFFGCYISSLVICLLVPVYCVPAVVIYFIYWIFHIGRKTN